jgi:hypothetical protein
VAAGFLIAIIRIEPALLRGTGSNPNKVSSSVSVLAAASERDDPRLRR